MSKFVSEYLTLVGLLRSEAAGCQEADNIQSCLRLLTDGQSLKKLSIDNGKLNAEIIDNPYVSTTAEQMRVREKHATQRFLEGRIKQCAEENPDMPIEMIREFFIYNWKDYSDVTPFVPMEEQIEKLKAEAAQEEEVIKTGLVQLNPEDEHSKIYKVKSFQEMVAELKKEVEIIKQTDSLSNGRTVNDFLMWLRIEFKDNNPIDWTFHEKVNQWMVRGSNPHKDMVSDLERWRSIGAQTEPSEGFP